MNVVNETVEFSQNALQLPTTIKTENNHNNLFIIIFLNS